jgi:hypothetical protein
MAVQWSLDEGGLLRGQPAGEHHTKRLGAGELFVKTVPSLVGWGGGRLVGWRAIA